MKNDSLVGTNEILEFISAFKTGVSSKKLGRAKEVTLQPIVDRLNEAAEHFAMKLHEDSRQEQNQHSALFSLGEMSAGIAHEINNPLAVIEGSVNLLPKLIDSPERLNAKIEVIKKSCHRVAKIVSGLRKFSRAGDRSVYGAYVLSDIAKESVFLTETTSLRHDTPVSFETESSAIVNCDEIEIEQVLINLINNAIDAVKDKAEKWVKVSVLDENGEVLVRVMDSGTGIPENVRGKLFDLFFTTKPAGEGIGLGLSIAKRILEEHKASVAVLQNWPNTCFEVRFPKAEPTKSVDAEISV